MSFLGFKDFGANFRNFGILTFWGLRVIDPFEAGVWGIFRKLKIPLIAFRIPFAEFRGLHLGLHTRDQHFGSRSILWQSTRSDRRAPEPEGCLSLWVVFRLSPKRVTSLA